MSNEAGLRYEVIEDDGWYYDIYSGDDLVATGFIIGKGPAEQHIAALEHIKYLESR